MVHLPAEGANGVPIVIGECCVILFLLLLEEGEEESLFSSIPDRVFHAPSNNGVADLLVFVW